MWVCFLLMLFICSGLRAESVFLSDGSIIEGRLVSENDSGIILKKNSDQTDVTIKYSSMMRVSYDTAYLKKIFIRLRGGNVLSGHVVEETKTHYVFRAVLNSPEEKKISREDVVAISGEHFSSKGTYYALGILPGAAQLYTRRNIPGYIFLGASIASLGYTGYSYSVYRKKRNDYRGVKRGEPSSTFNSKYNTYRKASRVFMISCALSAVLYSANWADVLYFGYGYFGTADSVGRGPGVYYDFSIGSRYALSGEPDGMSTRNLPARNGFISSNGEMCLSLGAILSY